MSNVITQRVLLLADIRIPVDREGNPTQSVTDRLDAFRESVMPSIEWGITLWQAPDLVEALKPFADLLEAPEDYEPDTDDGLARLYVPVDAITKAKAVIAKAEEV